jgi:energy-coupling factor transporter transmembrane protein EcfT
LHFHDQHVPDAILRAVQPIDTKTKILLSLLSSIAISFMITLEQIFLMAIMGLCLQRLYHARWKGIVVKMFIPLPLIFSLSVLVYISSPTGGIFQLGEVTHAYSRIGQVVIYTCRTLVLVFHMLLVIESEESFFEIIYALEDLRFPQQLIIILMFMYRSAIDLQIEASRMRDAQYSRNPFIYRRWFSPDQYRILGYTIGGLLSRALLRTSQRLDALQNRGFERKLYHSPKEFTLKGLTLLWIGTILIIIVLATAKLTWIFGDAL